MTTRSTDIHVDTGGQRLSWRAISAEGLRWVRSHPDVVSLAPEGIEVLRADCETVLRQAVADGLLIDGGDIGW